MLEVIHRQEFEGRGTGWVFDCPVEPAIQGGARSYGASVEAAEHSARHHLAREFGQTLDLEDARRLLRHLRASTSEA